MSAFVDALRAFKTADVCAAIAMCDAMRSDAASIAPTAMRGYADTIIPVLNNALRVSRAAPEIAALVEAVDEASAVACQVGMVRYVEIDADEWARVRAALSRLEKTVKP